MDGGIAMDMHYSSGREPTDHEILVQKLIYLVLSSIEISRKGHSPPYNWSRSCARAQDTKRLASRCIGGWNLTIAEGDLNFMWNIGVVRSS